MILCLSGGVDSFVAYHWYEKHYHGDFRTIYFDMGTPYTQKELYFVRKIDPNIIVDTSLKWLHNTGFGTYIPYRNLYIAMRASAHSDTVIIAGLKDDLVSDKNKAVFVEFSKLLTTLSGKDIWVISPFWDKTKVDVVKWYLDNVGKDIDSLWNLTQTVSCYSVENTNYCGECRCCFRKWVAFILNGIEIKFKNEKLLREYEVLAKKGHYIPERNEAILKAVKLYDE